MSNVPSLDVIVLTYNRATLFEKTLRSVCDQTYPDFTVKVLNNGSTDNTEEVFNKVKAEYPHRRFDYLKLKENHRDDYYIEQRNKFITADYVIVFHDDDLMHPRYVEYLMKIIPEHPECVFLGGKKKISETPEELEWDEPKGDFVIKDIHHLIKEYLRGNSLTYPSICYKSKYLKEIPYRQDLYGYAGDIALEMDIAEHGKVCILSDCFMHYRIHKSQDSNNEHEKPNMQQRINLVEKYASVLLSGDDECKQEFFNMIIRMSDHVDSFTCVIMNKYRSISPEINLIFKKIFNKNSIRRSMSFHRIMFCLAKKTHFTSPKKYARKYYKVKKRWLVISNISDVDGG